MTIRPLKGLLTRQILLAVIVPLLVMILLVAALITPKLRKDAETRQVQLARAVGSQVESHLESGAAIVRAAAAMPVGQALPQHGIQEHLDWLLAASDILNSLYVVDSGGSVVHVALRKGAAHLRSDLQHLNLSANPLVQKVIREKRTFWSQTFLSVVNGNLSVAHAVPGNGVTTIGEVDLARLTRFLRKITPTGSEFIFIIDHNGQIIADNNGHYTAQQLNIGNIPLVRQGIDTDEILTSHFHFNGSAMTGSIIKIPGVDWHVLVAATDATFYGPSRNISLIILAGIVFGLACGTLAAMYLARKLAERFDELSTQAQRVTDGMLSGEWPVSAIAEFNKLSANLQAMACRLQDSEALYRTLFEQLPDGIVVWSVPELKPIQFNPAAHQQLGYSREQFSALSVSELDATLDGAEQDDIVARLRRDGSTSFETTHRSSAGECRAIFVTARMLELAGRPAILALHRDITDRKRAEEERIALEKQLLHTQKLESLGVLAGGIAHDFNNILMAIVGNADLALMRLAPESPAVDNLQKIEQAATRAADLARQMLAYSGKGKFVVEHLDINRLIKEMLHMLEVSISKKVTLQLDFASALPTVEADATQLRQIVMNLVINASEAIGDTTGRITITTRCLACDRTYLQEMSLDADLVEGDYVCLDVADTGCGMDRETVAKIFDPFFTTKFTGRGLGMAAVLGIVRGHKGAIRVYSEPGRGTTFKVLLPASGRTECRSGVVPQGEWHGCGTVLLVDDEETVRGIGSEMLKELGFDVVTAVDGRDALERFRATPGIGLVLLDLTMPHMDGEQCFRELRRLDPQVKVIMTSGFSESEVSGKFAGQSLAGFIQKPYRLALLRDVIRRICEAGSAEG